MFLTIRGAKDGSDFAICMAIRMEVFVREQHVPLDEEMDEFDATATHYLALLGGVPIATARTRLLPDGTAKIERVAVREEHRRHGYGLQLMSHLIAELRKKPDLKGITIHAQMVALPFYEKMGFVADEQLFLEAGIAHRRMVLQDESARS